MEEGKMKTKDENIKYPFIRKEYYNTKTNKIIKKIKLLVYIPSEEEKQELSRIEDDVIDFIMNKIGKDEKNRLGKIVFLVESLYESFKDSLKE